MNNLINKTQEELIKYALKFYKISHKRKCNIDNPSLFTEKIQWYTFHYHNPLCPYIVDKVTFKDFIRSKLGEGYTIPLITSWKTIEEFENDWFNSDIMPNEFCLKSNLQSDGRSIKFIHNKNAENFEKLKEEIKEWLKPENTNINSIARNFYSSTPQILAEYYMSNFNNQLPDYKIFCFNGAPFCNYVATDHFGKDGSHISFYDMDWNKLNVQYGNHIVGYSKKPKHYDEMQDIARKLSKDFPFVRVDFFETEDKLYLAELTFNPGGGFTPYHPIEFDKKMGDLFILPNNN